MYYDRDDPDVAMAFARSKRDDVVGRSRRDEPESENSFGIGNLRRTNREPASGQTTGNMGVTAADDYGIADLWRTTQCGGLEKSKGGQLEKSRRDELVESSSYDDFGGSTCTWDKNRRDDKYGKSKTAGIGKKSKKTAVESSRHYDGTLYEADETELPNKYDYASTSGRLPGWVNMATDLGLMTQWHHYFGKIKKKWPNNQYGDPSMGRYNASETESLPSAFGNSRARNIRWRTALVIFIGLLLLVAVITPIVVLIAVKDEDPEPIYGKTDMEVTVTNKEYSASLGNATSDNYTQTASDFCAEIDTKYNASDLLHNYIGCQVTGFEQGSVVVHFFVIVVSVDNVLPTAATVNAVLISGAFDRGGTVIVRMGVFVFDKATVIVRPVTVISDNSITTTTTTKKAPDTTVTTTQAPDTTVTTTPAPYTTVTTTKSPDTTFTTTTTPVTTVTTKKAPITTVATTKVPYTTVTTTKVPDTTVTTIQAPDTTVTTTKKPVTTVSTTKVPNNTVTTTQASDTTVTTTQSPDTTVTTSQSPDTTVTITKAPIITVTTTKAPDTTVTTTKVPDNTVTTTQASDTTVTTTQSPDITVTTTQSPDTTVTTTKAPITTVTTTKVPYTTVTTTQLPDTTVTTTKVPDTTVTTTQAPDTTVTAPVATVTTTKVPDNTVTTTKVPDNTVTTTQASDTTVTTTSKIDTTVTITKAPDTTVTTTTTPNTTVTTTKAPSTTVITTKAPATTITMSQAPHTSVTTTPAPDTTITTTNAPDNTVTTTREAYTTITTTQEPHTTATTTQTPSTTVTTTNAPDTTVTTTKAPDTTTTVTTTEAPDTTVTTSQAPVAAEVTFTAIEYVGVIGQDLEITCTVAGVTNLTQISLYLIRADDTSFREEFVTTTDVTGTAGEVVHTFTVNCTDKGQLVCEANSEASTRAVTSLDVVRFPEHPTLNLPLAIFLDVATANEHSPIANVHVICRAELGTTDEYKLSIESNINGTWEAVPLGWTQPVPDNTSAGCSRVQTLTRYSMVFGQEYNNTELRCVVIDADEAYATPMYTSPSSVVRLIDITCTTKSEYFLHPYECRAYLQCGAGRMHVNDCGNVGCAQLVGESFNCYGSCQACGP